MIKRQIELSLQEDFGLGKVIVLLGARQVGKTTILERLSHGIMDHVLMLNCDDQEDVLLLENKSSTELRALLSPYDFVFIDEVQRVRNIGLTIKKMADVERETIEKTVKRNGGNKRQAAKDLDISERTIHRKISDSDLE